MSKIDEVLAKVERGEADANDAAWLREQFALHAIERESWKQAQPDDRVPWMVAPDDAPVEEGCAETQVLVHQWLVDNGIRDGFNDEQWGARLAAWAMVEVADLLQVVQIPAVWFMANYGPRAFTVMGAIEHAASLTSMLLARPAVWQSAGLRVVDTTPVTFKLRLVELAIPLLAFAHLLGIDLVQAVDEAVTQRLASEAVRQGLVKAEEPVAVA